MNSRGMISGVAGVVGLVAVLAVATASPPKKAKEAAKASPLDRMKSLAGEWKEADTAGKKEKTSEVGKNGVTATYKVVSGGSAVMEDLFPGSDHEMITMYHMDGDHLMMTHYCAAGNQPRMRGRVEGKDKIEYTFVDGTNMKPTDSHMHACTYTFIDKEHIKVEWTWYEDGKAKETKTFELVRKK